MHFVFGVCLNIVITTLAIIINTFLSCCKVTASETMARSIWKVSLVNTLRQQCKNASTVKNVIFVHLGVTRVVPSVLCRRWLGGRKGIRPVKTEQWGAGVVICLELGADLRMAQLMTLPLTVSCFSKIQIGFTFLVSAHLGSPGKKGS